MEATENKILKTDVFKVPFTRLAMHDNLRVEMGDIDELVQSIKSKGVIQPLRGYKAGNLYCVTEGSRRFAAMEKIYKEDGTDTVCLLLPEPRDRTDQEIIIHQLLANDGKPFTPLEQSEGVRQLLAAGMKEREIANKLGKSQTYIKRLASLITAPEGLTKLIKKKDISATTAMDLIAKGEDRVNEFIQEQKDGGFAKYEQEQMPFEDTGRKEKKQASITKKSIENTLNSWKEFTRYAHSADMTTMYQGKLYSPEDVFKFMLQMKNNELGQDDISKFFNAVI